MGQSPSTAVPPPWDPTRRDYTADLPDECLAAILHFLDPSDRKRCSAVCRRWLRVDGESRQRLSLNAESYLSELAPSLFARFDSVTKLSLRCDRRSTSINDDGLIRISKLCVNLNSLKLHGCGEITVAGMSGLAKNCTLLRSLSCDSCDFGAEGIYAVIEHCKFLEDLSIKRHLGADDDATTTTAAAATDSVSAVPSSLRSIILKELADGISFAPLIIGSEKLQTLKVIRCLGDWDSTLGAVGRLNPRLIGVHLEKIQVSDLGLRGISKCQGLEFLQIVKTPDCSDLGLTEIAERCKLLKKIHIDGWRTNRNGDYGLFSVAECCPNLQELVLIAMYPAAASITAIASNCRGLVRVALCGVASVGDAEIQCIAAKSVALRRICVKSCPVSDAGVAAFASGCPNLFKLKVRKCRNVSGEVVEWLHRRRRDLVISFDYYSEVEALDGSGSELVAQESTTAVAASSSSGSNRLSMIRTKLGFLAGRSFVPLPCAFRRSANIDDISGGSVS